MAAHFHTPSKSVWFHQSINILAAVLSPMVAQAADYWGRKWLPVSLSLAGGVGSLVVSRASSRSSASHSTTRLPDAPRPASRRFCDDDVGLADTVWQVRASWWSSRRSPRRRLAARSSGGKICMPPTDVLGREASEFLVGRWPLPGP